MNDLHALLGKLDPTDLILDVRTPEEFQDGHIQGAKNIPYNEVSNSVDDLKKYSKIYLHCQKGRRADIATHTLAKLGLTNIVCINDSGMADWISAGYPVVKSS
jgi:rhodanese-related sulfurtransferase